MQAIQPKTGLPTPLTAQGQVALHEPTFWRPRFAVHGNMLRYTPFMFWLITILRPARATVVGLGDGVSCFALCQADERLRLEGSYTGIHLSNNETTEIPEAVKKHAVQFYEGLVDLRSARDPADAIAGLMLGSQDLLLIDLQQSDEWPENALEDWRSLLSPHGCLVVHGLRKMSQTKVAHSLLRQLSHLSCINIEIGAGLVILYNDPHPPTELAPLISQGRLPQEASVIFTRLGQSLIADLRCEALTSEVVQQRAALAEARNRATALEAEMAELSAAFEARGRKTSKYQALYFDCDTELKKLRRIETETLNARVERQKKNTALAERDALAAQLRQNRENHYCETAALTLLLEKQREAAANEALALRQQVDALASDNAALLSSTSWKLTSPLRRIVSKFSSRAYRR